MATVAAVVQSSARNLPSLVYYYLSFRLFTLLFFSLITDTAVKAQN